MYVSTRWSDFIPRFSYDSTKMLFGRENLETGGNFKLPRDFCFHVNDQFPGKPSKIAVADGISHRHSGILVKVFN